MAPNPRDKEAISGSDIERRVSEASAMVDRLFPVSVAIVAIIPAVTLGTDGPIPYSNLLSIAIGNFLLSIVFYIPLLLTTVIRLDLNKSTDWPRMYVFPRTLDYIATTLFLVVFILGTGTLVAWATRVTLQLE